MKTRATLGHTIKDKRDQNYSTCDYLTQDLARFPWIRIAAHLDTENEHDQAGGHQNNAAIVDLSQLLFKRQLNCQLLWEVEHQI